MATLTTNGRAVLAQALKSIPFYIGLGAGLAEWDTAEKTTSTESRDLTALVTPVFYRKITDLRFVKDDAAGDIQMDNGTYSFSDTPTNLLYVSTRLDFADCPNATIREVGIFANLTPVDTVPEGQYSFTPDEVKDAGTLFFIDHQTTPIYRNAARRESFEIVIAL